MQRQQADAERAAEEARIVNDGTPLSLDDVFRGQLIRATGTGGFGLAFDQTIAAQRDTDVRGTGSAGARRSLLPRRDFGRFA